MFRVTKPILSQTGIAMTRKYSLVIEGDPTGYSAYVPELPTILVTGRSLEELTTRATEAIRLYWETVHTSVPYERQKHQM